jgi:hypothetical protein
VRVWCECSTHNACATSLLHRAVPYEPRLSRPYGRGIMQGLNKGIVTFVVHFQPTQQCH